MKITVITSAYNQEDYIFDCIKSVVNQTGDYSLCHVIIDDASSDDTPKIISNLSKEYSHIVPVLRSDNLNNLNFAWQYVQDADFIAFLDGDDFWIDKHKLDKQLKLFHQNPGAELCGTRFKLYHQDKNVYENIPYWKTRKTLSFEDLVLGNELTMSTLLIRRSFIIYLEEIRSNSPVYDYFMVLLASIRSPCMVLNDYTTVKREHKANKWSHRPQEERYNFREKMFNEIIKTTRNPYVLEVIGQVKKLHKLQKNQSKISPEKRLEELDILFPTNLKNNVKLLIWKANLSNRIGNYDKVKTYLELINLDHPQRKRASLILYLNTDPDKFLQVISQYQPNPKDKFLKVIINGLIRLKKFEILKDLINRSNQSNIKESIVPIYRSLFIMLNDGTHVNAFFTVYQKVNKLLNVHQLLILTLMIHISKTQILDYKSSLKIIQSLQIEDKMLIKHKNILIKKCTILIQRNSLGQSHQSS